MATQQYMTAPPRMTESPAGAPSEEQSPEEQAKGKSKVIVLELYEDGTVEVYSEGGEEESAQSLDEAFDIVRSMAGAGEQDAQAAWDEMAAKRPPMEGM